MTIAAYQQEYQILQYPSQYVYVWQQNYLL